MVSRTRWHHSKGRSEDQSSSLLSRMTPRLMLLEMRRMVLRTRFWVTALLAAAVGAYGLYQYRPLPGLATGAGTVRVLGAFSYHGTDTFLGTAPLIAGVVAAGSLAADRSIRYPTLVLVRGVSRPQYLLAKAVGMAAAAWLATFASCVLLFISAVFIFPWGSTALVGDYSVQPFPELFVSHPFLNDLLMAGLISLGAASLALSGMAAGALVTNEYVAATVPFLLVIGGAFLFDQGIVAFFSPYTYLDLQGMYSHFVPPSLLPFGAPIYWLVFGVAALAVGGAILKRKELD